MSESEGNLLSVSETFTEGENSSITKETFQVALKVSGNVCSSFDGIGSVLVLR